MRRESIATWTSGEPVSGGTALPEVYVVSSDRYGSRADHEGSRRLGRRFVRLPAGTGPGRIEEDRRSRRSHAAGALLGPLRAVRVIGGHRVADRVQPGGLLRGQVQARGGQVGGQ